MRRIFLAGVPVLLCGLLTAPVLQAADTKLLVKCVKDNGEPVVGILAFAQDPRGGKPVEQKTNKQGVAEFKKLQPGVYRVYARLDGFEPALYEFVGLAAGEQKPLDLKFAPGDSARKLYFEDPAVEQQGNALFQEGVQAMQQNKLDLSAQKFIEALAINPCAPWTRQNLGLVYATMQKWDLAQQELEKGIQTALALRPFYAAQGGQENAAEQMARGLQALLTNMPLLKLQNEAEAALQQNKLEEAIAKFQEIIKVAPNDPGTLYNLALAQTRAGRFQEAAANIDKALVGRPDDKNAQDLKKWLAQREQAEAAKRFENAWKAAEDAFNQGKYEEAVQKYEAARAAAPEEHLAAIWAGLGRTYGRLNREPELVDAYRKASELNPQKIEYSQELAEYYFNKEMVSEAMQVCLEAYKRASTPADQGLFTLGANFMKKNKKKIAQALFEETLKVNPQHPEAHYELGMICFYDLKENERAKALLAKYAELGKDQGHLDNAKAVSIVISRPKK
jgi:tetratricopeptide (TPR) repeat protein